MDQGSISDNYITALFQDPLGVILVGTQGGLNILDPETNEFRIYEAVDEHFGLSEALITTLYRDRNDFIWIGTAEDGLYRFDRKTFLIDQFTNEPGNPNSLSDNWIVTIYEDQQGVLWFGTQSGGLNRFCSWRTRI